MSLPPIPPHPLGLLYPLPNILQPFRRVERVNGIPDAMPKRLKEILVVVGLLVPYRRRRAADPPRRGIRLRPAGRRSGRHARGGRRPERRGGSATSATIPPPGARDREDGGRAARTTTTSIAA